jgi:DNA replication protein DnaC
LSEIIRIGDGSVPIGDQNVELRQMADIFSQENAEAAARLTIKTMRERNYPEAQVYLAEMELAGGPCRECQKPWVKVNSKNKITELTYFIPDCTCVIDKERAEAEKDIRQRYKMSRYRNAHIPEDEWEISWDNWDTRVFPSEKEINRAAINRAMDECAKYASGNEWRRGEGLILCGYPGTGKTRCALNILKDILDANPMIQGAFIHIDDLAERIIKSDDHRGYIGSLLENSIVIIDDMDRIPTDKEWMRGQVFGLYNRLIQEGIAIVGTTNLESEEEISRKFEQAIVSRLFGYCRIVKFGGGPENDYRILRRVYER